MYSGHRPALRCSNMTLEMGHFGVFGTLRSIDLEVWDAQIPGSGHLGTLEMADLDPFGGLNGPYLGPPMSPKTLFSGPRGVLEWGHIGCSAPIERHHYRGSLYIPSRARVIGKS